MDCRRVVLLLTTLWGLCLTACVPWRGGGAAENEGARAAAELVNAILPAVAPERLAWVGLRDAEGMPTDGPRAVGEHVLSAMMRQGLRVVDVDTLAAPWSQAGVLPVAAWTGLQAAVAVGGRVHTAGAWAHVRLVAVDTRQGHVLAAAQRRLKLGTLERLADRTRQRGAGAAEDPRVELRVQLLTTRLDGNMTRQLQLQENGSLLVGDRLQLRVRPLTDCTIYAFLLDSDGVQRDLLVSQQAYTNRVQYGPGQDRWLELQGTDRVHSLYIVAAKRLPEDRAELWDQVRELVEQGRIDRYLGLDLQDQLLADYVLRELPSEVELTVQRGDAAASYDRAEEIILEDGTRLESRPLILQGQNALIRVISFTTQ
jgi:hypothetical protein